MITNFYIYRYTRDLVKTCNIKLLAFAWQRKLVLGLTVSLPKRSMDALLIWLKKILSPILIKTKWRI